LEAMRAREGAAGGNGFEPLLIDPE